ncbi:HAD family hydrolase [Actinotalea sp. C106]|uniref:HAD family hydrolase n=1 Tax=Actinotalea sp. C106 TaxID=2908644 RepID=UPI002028FA67|nr:HAD family hydrolase [Actinotalea sp. C106]
MQPPATQPVINLVVTDLDNTLWDWFGAWYSSFSALLNEVSRLSGVPTPALEEEARKVHQRRRTTEYSYLLNEIPSLLALSKNPLMTYDKALHAQNSARKESTRLYPGVLTTLETIRAAGVPIVGYTESLSFWTEWRIRTLELDGVLAALYSSPDHDLPDGVSFEDLRTQDPEHYGLKLTPHEHVAAGTEKPSVAILNEIIQTFGARPATTLYIGDSLIKDVAMAQAAGAHDAHAAYGQVQHLPEYALLRRVTHWTDELVEKERRATERAGVVTPTHVLDRGLDQLLTMFAFEGAADDTAP